MNDENNKLGLPLEYNRLAEFFDAHNILSETELTNGVIEKHLSDYDVKTVLDFTCGTGSQVFYLHDHGYKVTGVDNSPPLLTMARNTALQDNISINFLEGDMRKTKVGTFDAIITIFNAIGHLTKEEFSDTLQNIYQNLDYGGVYLFDIFNLDAMTDATVKNLAMDYKKNINNKLFHHTQYSTINRDMGQITSYDNYTIDSEKGVRKKITNTFMLQIYSAKELQVLLEENEFKMLAQFGIDGSEFKQQETIKIFTLTQK